MNLKDLTVARTIPASAERIFDAWLNPSSPGGPWFGAERVILNPVVDGLFYHAVKHEGRTWPHYGRFLRIDRPNRLEHTWVSEATKGLESVVNLTLEPRGDQTEVTIRHPAYQTMSWVGHIRKAGRGFCPLSLTASPRADRFPHQNRFRRRSVRFATPRNGVIAPYPVRYEKPTYQDLRCTIRPDGQQSKVIESIVGEQLTSVEFVQDYVQLRFGGPTLTAFVWPVVTSEGEPMHWGETGYRDQLCARIGSKAVAVSLQEGDAVNVDFEDGAKISISLRPQDSVGPEAGHFCLCSNPGDPILEF